MNNLVFKVAESYFHVINKNECDVRQLLPSYAPFYIAHAENVPCMFTATIDNTLIQENPSEEDKLGEFDSGDAKHEIYRVKSGGYLIYIKDYYGELTCGIQTNADFSLCEIGLLGKESNWAFGLNNALMIAFAFSGAHHHILLMHASVIMNDGFGYLFLGKSGTGKSTHSRLWLENIPGSELLNDDNPAVRYDIENNKVIVYGTPWSGKTPCYRNLMVNVGAFLRLQQYPENIISKDSGIKAFASILSSCSTMIWDKPSYNGICSTVTKIAERVSAFHLQCLPNPEAAQLSYKHLHLIR